MKNIFELFTCAYTITKQQFCERFRCLNRRESRVLLHSRTWRVSVPVPVPVSVCVVCVTNICVLNTLRILFLCSPISPRPPPAPAPAFRTFPQQSNRSSPQLLYSKGIDVLASHLRQVDHDRRSSFEGFQSQAQWVCCMLFFGSHLQWPWCVLSCFIC